jgi:hypothetical protein
MFGKKNYTAFQKAHGSDQIYEKMNEISERYGESFANYLLKLKKELTGSTTDLMIVDNTITILNKLRKDLMKTYLASLMFPEKYKGSRIPTKFPVPSAVFQQTDFILVTTNSHGNFTIQWCPQVLLSQQYSTGNPLKSEVVINTHPDLNGYDKNENYVGSNVLTNPLVVNWQAFRLVSACAIVQYVGSIVNVQGTLGAGLDISTETELKPDPNYSNFSYIEDRLWNDQISTDDGLKISYFPKDYSDFTFIKPDKVPKDNGLSSVSRLLIYGQSLPSSQQCIRIDFIKNIEAIPGPAFADIIETSYIEDDGSSGGDAPMDASKIMSQSGLVVSRLSKQDEIQDILNTPDNSYKEKLIGQKL